MRETPVLRVARAPGREPWRGILSAGGRSWPCAIGRSGLKVLKREGDGGTPVGRWTLQAFYFRADHGPRPATLLPGRATRRNDGWCDDPAHPLYNRPVRLPFGRNREGLWRGDRLYDVVVVLSHNTRPRVRGLGSAIFMHLARPGYTATEGCVATDIGTLRFLLAHARRGTPIVIG
ncbi:MAG: L,D-transpeptidase [Hyphomicrobiales bacterium]